MCFSVANVSVTEAALAVVAVEDLVSTSGNLSVGSS